MPLTTRYSVLGVTTFFRSVTLLALLWLLSINSATSQNRHVYSEYFYNGQYATAQCTAWSTWRASLVPGQYMSFTIRGTYDPVGYTCTDVNVVNDLAYAIKNQVDYISPTVNGHVWHFCVSLTHYVEGGVWVDPGTSCNGSDCPSPGYLVRPCIGPSNSNWGGVNTATCGAPNQLMEMWFEFPSSPNDAGIPSIDSPNNFCPGSYPITATLKNFGTMPLTSVQINWSLNGVPQTAMNWTGYLDTLDQASRQTSITLMPSYNFAANTPYTISIWTLNPNGAPDTVTFNDTLTVTRKSSMSGTYTIGGVSPDYGTFTDAVTDLVNNGLCGPVVFKVRSGTYTEHVSIGEIAGSSATNTVIFESETGNNTDVTVTSVATGTTDNYAIALNGCDYVTVRNMSMTATNATYSTCVLVQGGAEYCTLEDLNLASAVSTSTSTYAAVIYSPSGSLDHNLTVRGCSIQNGSYGIYLYGSGTTSLERDVLIENNTVDNFAYMGIYSWYLDSPQYLHNTITSFNAGYTSKYATYMYYNYNALRFIGNKINVAGTTYTYGSLFYYDVGTSTNYGIIANNMFTFGGNISAYCYGLRHGYGAYTKVMFNTIRGYNTGTSTYYGMYTYNGSEYRYSNNIVNYYGAGYAWYCYPGTNVTYSDYNVLYTSGANLAYWNSVAHPDLSALRASSGMDQNTIVKVPDFADVATGDLHLTGASEDDPDLIGAFDPDVVNDIDLEPRMLPYRGADEACYITKGSVWYELTDANGVQTPYAFVPGNMGLHYHVEFPEYDATITVTLRFYNAVSNALIHTTLFQVSKSYATTVDGVQVLALSGIPVGVYRVEATFNTKNSCGGYRDYIPSQEAFMLLNPGDAPCIVWPGDVNNDGIVNYGDRTSLNTYIHDANLSSIWLTGPARYRADEVENPLTYLEWEAQAAVPWETVEGCYMDADGNGAVNSFDYIPIKLNWMRDHSVSGMKMTGTSAPVSFDVSQNYPNPFNPTTQIRYNVPEQSQVTMLVTDDLGREVAMLIDAEIPAGAHTATFDASHLDSGVYFVHTTMTGLESGISYSRTIRMTLAK